MTTNLSLSIREANLKDTDSLYKMICELEDKILDRDNFDFVIQHNMKNPWVRYFIAESDGIPVGMGSCHIQPLLHHTAFVAEIQEMYVDDSYRSREIGKKLMKQLVIFAKSNGAIQVEVTSRAYREDAHRFYQREGFEKSHVKLVRYF